MTSDEDKDDEDDEDDEAVNEAWERYQALDPHERVEMITTRLGEVREKLRDKIETKELGDEDGGLDTVHWQGVIAADRRSFRLRVDLEHTQPVLSLGCRNQLGLFLWRRDFDETPAGYVAFGPPEHAVFADLGIDGAESIFSRMSPAFVDEVAGWVDELGVSELAAADDRLRLELFDLVYDAGDDLAAKLGRLVDANTAPKLATFFECGGDLTCAFCRSKYLPTPARRCPHCGAPTT